MHCDTWARWKAQYNISLHLQTTLPVAMNRSSVIVHGAILFLGTGIGTTPCYHETKIFGNILNSIAHGTIQRNDKISPRRLIFGLANAIAGFDMSSLCHLFWLRPALLAHATRLKILRKFHTFHYMSRSCMGRNRQKQCSASHFCSTLQCTRGT